VCCLPLLWLWQLLERMCSCDCPHGCGGVLGLLHVLGDVLTELLKRNTTHAGLSASRQADACSRHGVAALE
jgi:hypothetical protein